MNRMLMQFNLSYVRREWSQRIERNERTIYHSRPDPGDFLEDLRNLRQLAELKGLGQGLGSLVEHGLLTSSAFYQVQKVESFVRHNRQRLMAMRESGPDPEQIQLCREYFQHRRGALRVLTPLFQRLLETPPPRPSLTDADRLHAMCRPMDSQRMGLDANNQLYILGPVWVGEPHLTLDPLLLMARTDCYIRPDTLEAIEAAMEGWTPYSIAEHREEIGRKFLMLLDETLRQGNAAIVLRTLRAVGLLERLIPHFAEIQGLIHVVADHSYTVDEHSFVLVEVLGGMKLLADVLPHPERPAMLADYQRTKDALALKKFANKYAQELRMLSRVTELRSNPAVRAFFQYMDEVRLNSLEYLVDVNLLEHGYTTCMIALNEIEKTRKALGTLIQLMVGLPLQQQRCLLLAGLLHDLRKPALN
ncbi:MAG TPA: hypothetical protein VL359_14600, partial [bacterium]|nr:hypothetical protein [bacterium]